MSATVQAEGSSPYALAVLMSEYRIGLARTPCAVSLNSQFLRLCEASHKRKAWLFCWTEIGAEHVGVFQSLLTACRLHGVYPYTYLVDVLQRVSQRPDKAIEDLTPRRWKALFADNPLRSDLYLAS